MALRPPPIQDKIQGESTILQTWIKWFSSIKDCFDDILDRLGTVETKLDEHIYWFDKADATTTTTPISHTGGATNTYLTNDGAGTNSTEYNPTNKDDIWDTTAQSFDFSSLTIGDSVFFRVSTEIDLDVNNQEYSLVMDLAIGSSAPYSLTFGHEYYKTTGVKPFVTLNEIYIGNAETRDYPAKFRFDSADDADIEVIGWYTKVTAI